MWRQNFPTNSLNKQFAFFFLRYIPSSVAICLSCGRPISSRGQIGLIAALHSMQMLELPFEQLIMSSHLLAYLSAANVYQLAYNRLYYMSTQNRLAAAVWLALSLCNDWAHVAATISDEKHYLFIRMYDMIKFNLINTQICCIVVVICQPAFSVYHLSSIHVLCLWCRRM